MPRQPRDHKFEVMVEAFTGQPCQIAVSLQILLSTLSQGHEKGRLEHILMATVKDQIM